MAELATLARPYANAVFEVAKKGGELGSWSRMLALLAAAVNNDTVQVLLADPETEEEQKAYRLSAICGDELNDRGRRFVQVLAANKRLALLPEVFELFEALRAEEQSTLDVKVTSAYALSDGEAEKLKAALTRRFQREVNLSSEVDASLIGGAVIRAGDTIIDGSVRGKLSKLAESIQRT
ncbi:MAG TPA: F0F1 ATP synthase subunit delta [Pseudomonadales bacterium]